MGVVIYLPLRRCDDCAHFEAAEDDEGFIHPTCSEWSEPIDDERVAADCPDFEGRSSA